jgi:hypothetical protein
MGFWEHWRWSRLFPSWHSFILMTLLRNFTTNDERSSFKLDLVLGQSGTQAQGRAGGLRRFRDPHLRGVRTAANWRSAITRWDRSPGLFRQQAVLLCALALASGLPFVDPKPKGPGSRPLFRGGNTRAGGITGGWLLPHGLLVCCTPSASVYQGLSPHCTHSSPHRPPFCLQLRFNQRPAASASSLQQRAKNK